MQYGDQQKFSHGMIQEKTMQQNAVDLLLTLMAAKQEANNMHI